MNLLALIVALLLGWFRPFQQRASLSHLLSDYVGFFPHHLNAGKQRHGEIAWMLAVLPVVLAIVLLLKVLGAVHPLFAWALNVAVLYFSVSFRPLHHFSGVYHALRADHLEQSRGLLSAWCGRDTSSMNSSEIARVAIEEALLKMYHNLFAIVLWFVLFSMIGLGGAVGALLYRLAQLLDQRWGADTSSDMIAFGQFAQRAWQWLNWLPVRFSALTFALVGNFEDALYGWRNQASDWPDRETGILLSSGAGALGVRLGNVEVGNYTSARSLADEADADYMQSTTGLVWRALVFQFIILMMLTVANLL